MAFSFCLRQTAAAEFDLQDRCISAFKKPFLAAKAKWFNTKPDF
jgi:hypothetical protein